MAFLEDHHVPSTVHRPAPLPRPQRPGVLVQSPPGPGDGVLALGTGAPNVGISTSIRRAQ